MIYSKGALYPSEMKTSVWPFISEIENSYFTQEFFVCKKGNILNVTKKEI